MADIHIEIGISNDRSLFVGFEPPLNDMQKQAVDESVTELVPYFQSLQDRTDEDSTPYSLYGVRSQEVIAGVHLGKVLKKYANKSARALRTTGASVSVDKTVRHLAIGKYLFDGSVEEFSIR